jgi:ABC-2 type transport system ATP-binding protein
VRALIRELGREKTVVLSSHILSEVSQLCSRILVINDGVLRADDSPEALNQSLSEGAGVRILLEVGAPQAELVSGLEAIDGVRTVTATGTHEGHATVEVEAGDPALRSRLASAVVQAGWELYELRLESLSLEDIFIRLMAADEATEPVAESGLTPEEEAAAARFEATRTVDASAGDESDETDDTDDADEDEKGGTQGDHQE